MGTSYLPHMDNYVDFKSRLIHFELLNSHDRHTLSLISTAIKLLKYRQYILLTDSTAVNKLRIKKSNYYWLDRKAAKTQIHQYKTTTIKIQLLLL